MKSHDAQAMIAISRSRTHFCMSECHGRDGFSRRADKQIERLVQFDPQTSQIILVTRVVGE
jgi:hypothetical protein